MSNLLQTLILLVAVIAAGYFAYRYNRLKNNSFKSLSNQELEQKLAEKVKQLEQEKQREIDQLKHQLTQDQTTREKELRAEIWQELESKNQIVLQKKELELETKLKEEENRMRQRIIELQANLEKREVVLQERLDKLAQEREHIEQVKQDLREIKEKLQIKQAELEQREASLTEQINQQLESIAKLTRAEARQQILEQTREELGEELLLLQQKILDQVEERANEEARNIVAMAIQRCSSEVANELTITSIKLSSEDEKGKIIGKGGRNIQWLEKTLGVEIIIDETPEVVTISGFSSIRRNIAKRSLEKLLADGRIHPSSIEEMYEKAKSEIAQEIAEAGKEAVDELGIVDFPSKLVRILGRLKFRTSYGQNMLKHSIEMAKLAGLLARELNEHFPSCKPIDVDICVKGALLHDIGKALDEEYEPKTDHVTLGEKICDMFNLDWRIKKCISSHHSTGGDVHSYYDKEHGFCIEAAIVDACDNISGGRPGARKESMEAYFQRLEALENIANSVEGVTKSWVMRGARELWVFFDTEKVSAARMHSITRKIAKRISSEVKFPGEIKIIGMWEDRVVEYAS